MPRNDLRLRVNGLDYAGWKSARVNRSIECIAGGFDLDVSDRWDGQDRPWPIVEEDECQLVINGTPVISGYVDRRSLSWSKDDHRLAVSGRDRAAALVDCSADLGKWEFLNVDVLAFARKLCQPFGVTVTIQTPLRVPPPIEKVSISPGDTAWDALDGVLRKAGLLAVSDGAGGVTLTRAGTMRATTALVRGENVLSGWGEYDAAARFRRYIVTAQRPGSDEWSGSAAAGILAEARDETVRRAERVRIIRCETAATPAYARSRAEWEATVAAARARTVTYTVQGWTQGDGSLWPLNALVAVRDPWLGIDGDMLIAGTTHALTLDGGTTTELALRRPEAFTPEPVVKPSGAWKELA